MVVAEYVRDILIAEDITIGVSISVGAQPEGNQQSSRSGYPRCRSARNGRDRVLAHAPRPLTCMRPSSPDADRT
jgi:hypothetical protein